ncbi:hypothetical protein XBKB1_920009 [Xenorhabdus bovienii str. kraussei Becker Underwood]|uniref:Uncharacterized protein n=1 Tax=Xenorhabdus bovienii str. kraussei Becker Underwood TaxID=1398204 RepID=A0A077Q1E6_XENBV|nr:hypothetical protein XBKB1_920009 [Xenorhabdus bovienii str. kraussei Becker Underwood]
MILIHKIFKLINIFFMEIKNQRDCGSVFNIEIIVKIDNAHAQ